MDAWMQDVERLRKSKDQAFRNTPDSPIPPEERGHFDGLHYFPIDARYRLEIPLTPGPPDWVTMPRTGGDEADYERVGWFALDLPEGKGKLWAYRSEGAGHELFLPFRDATSGPETYGAGRYLEATPLSAGKWLVDFNRAYHPFCAYNEAFTCPLPPAENHLTFAVRAGERL